jgi:hypothetical protein
LVGKPEGKRPLRRLCCGWEYNISIDLKETAWQVVDWMQMVQYRDQWQVLVNTATNLRVP